LVLRGSAAILWDLLERPTSLADLVDELAELYQENPERIESDLRASLDEMRELSVIDDVDAA
jgi:hypothetical protein